MADPADIQRDLQVLEAELKKLEAEYNMFFSGRLPRPPWETRGRVEGLIKRWDRGHIQGSAERFRFNTLQTRFATFADLWDRGLRAREEGRPGPFRPPTPSPAVPSVEATKTPPTKPEPKIAPVSLRDPASESDKLHALYDSLNEARRRNGERAVPFHRFAALVKDQVTRLREKGSGDVTFRVGVKDGKVTFTAKAARGKKKDER
jgi:hypothetical protein